MIHQETITDYLSFYNKVSNMNERESFKYRYYTVTKYEGKYVIYDAIYDEQILLDTPDQVVDKLLWEL